MIPAKVACSSCGQEGYEIEFLRCIRCLERFCIAPLKPCVRGCECTTPRVAPALPPDFPEYFQQELRDAGAHSNVLP
jgi:hypothetical protein